MVDDEKNLWQRVLDGVRAELEPEEFRRWFGETAYASDSGDQVTVWVPSEPVRRFLEVHYLAAIDRALETLGRGDTHVRFLVTGIGEEEEEEG